MPPGREKRRYLRKLAAAYAGLPETRCTRVTGKRLVIFAAMSAHPEMLSGTGRFDLALTLAGTGRWVLKGGSEGVEAIAVRDRRIGIAIKIADGATRALPPVTLAVLSQLGLLDDPPSPALAGYAAHRLTNPRGIESGRSRPEAAQRPRVAQGRCEPTSSFAYTRRNRSSGEATVAYVPGFEHDVFVSYAHADNQQASGGETGLGWITTLRHNLIVGPGTILKDVYIDHKLKPGDPFGTDLLREVERSALLLIVLSQNYIESEWCGKELDHFVKTHGDDPSKPRDVVVVEIRPFESFEGVPENIKNLRKELIHAQFWYQEKAKASIPRLAGDPSPNVVGTAVYWLGRDTLRDALESRLRDIRRRHEMEMGLGPRVSVQARDAFLRAPAPEAEKRSVGILLADVTDDLVPQRNQVKYALEKERIPVLPDGDYVGRSATEFAAAFGPDATASLLFVQLLSPTAGRIPKGESIPLPQLQFHAARKADLPIMQWCAAMPDPDKIADAAHQALFATEFLMALNLERFKDEVIKKYRELGKKLESSTPAVPEAGERSRKTVFFDDLAADRDLAQQIRAIIKKHDYEIRGLPKGLALDQDEADVIQHMEPCQAGILVYTNRRDQKTVWSRLIRFRKHVAQGRLMLAYWGIYFGPPPDKGDLWDEFGFGEEEKIVAIPGMDGLNEAGLVKFLQTL